MNFRDTKQNWINKNSKPFFQTCSFLCHRQERHEFMLETTFQKLVKVENVQQADSSRKGILLRILGPTVFFTRRQTMKDERNAFSFSGIRIPYFPYLVSIPIETLFAHFSSLSPFPDNYNRRRLAFRRCHPSPCSLQRKRREREGE